MNENIKAYCPSCNAMRDMSRFFDESDFPQLDQLYECDKCHSVVFKPKKA